MVDNWFKYLVIFSQGAVWSNTNLLHRWKEQSIIEEAVSIGYIEECSVNDINAPQYRITEKGRKFLND